MVPGQPWLPHLRQQQLQSQNTLIIVPDLELQRLKGLNPQSHCYFLLYFRGGVPKDVNSLWFGWEGGAKRQLLP